MMIIINNLGGAKIKFRKGANYSCRNHPIASCAVVQANMSAPAPNNESEGRMQRTVEPLLGEKRRKSSLLLPFCCL